MPERELFTFLAYCWDITRAQEIAARMPVHETDIRPWFGLLPLIRLDEEHIDHADLLRPLIFVKIQEASGNVMLIDGWHRLARAQKENVSHLPLVLLDEEHEYESRLYGGRKSAAQDD